RPHARRRARAGGALDVRATGRARGSARQGHDRRRPRRGPRGVRPRRRVRRAPGGAGAPQRDHRLRGPHPLRRRAPYRAGGRRRRPGPAGRQAPVEGKVMSYYVPRGGLPPQTELTTERAVFTEAYAVLPRRTMSDITTSVLPHWDHTRAWVLARPLSGFAETFAQYVVEVGPGGGSNRPEPDRGAEGVLFVVDGQVELVLHGTTHTLVAGSYAYLAPAVGWTLRNRSEATATFHWIRKAYEPVEGYAPPPSFVTHEREVDAVEMPDTDGAWRT